MAFDFESIRGVILDMDGVLWRDRTPIGDLPAIFADMQRRGWQIFLATNNATQTAEQFVEKLAGFGVSVEPSQVINSGRATAAYLQQRYPQGGPVFVLGEAGLVKELTDAGFYESSDQPLAVVVGLDRAMTYDKLKTAGLLARAGIPFIGTNLDKTYPTPEGLVPGAGTFVLAVQAVSDVQPIVIGKPEPEMYWLALRRMGLTPEQTLVVGDRLETDIAGAQQIGCVTALVLSGVATREEVNGWNPPPDYICADLSELLGL
jgi:4-nitrophenyl phosphatase